MPADENKSLLLDTQLKYDSVKFLNNMYDIHEEWDNPIGNLWTMPWTWAAYL